MTSAPPPGPPQQEPPPGEPSALRRTYARGTLVEADLAPTWWEQFAGWFRQAGADPAVVEANAVQVATASADARPSVRTVLCRGHGPDGIVFFTNYTSAKGHDLAENPRAAAVFSWLAQERQVRLAGDVTRVSREETEAYVAGRPVASVLGSWASPQSEVIASRAELEARVAEVAAREVTGAPPFWGGYRLRPTEVEFWQGRPDRLHDRLRYRLVDVADGPPRWVVERLAP